MTQLRHYKINTTVSTVPTTRVYPLADPENDQGQIPAELADLTLGILRLHKSNGDLAWVQDVAHDMELEQGPNDLFEALLNNLSPEMIREILTDAEGIRAELQLPLREKLRDLIGVES